MVDTIAVIHGRGFRTDGGGFAEIIVNGEPYSPEAIVAAISASGVVVPREPTHEMELALSDALASGDYSIGECLQRANEAAPKATSSDPAGVSSADIDTMVNRFLAWKLPDDFHPDAGIAFTPSPMSHGWPVGTNLLTADQARTMLEHVCNLPATPKVSDAESLSDWSERMATKELGQQVGAGSFGIEDTPQADPAPSVAGDDAECACSMRYEREDGGIYCADCGAMLVSPAYAEQLEAKHADHTRIVAEQKARADALAGDAASLLTRWREQEQEGPAYTACTIGKCADELDALLSEAGK